MTTLTAPPTTLQGSLIEALHGSDPERALEQAFLKLSRGGDIALILAMVKALVRIGLAGIAVRLLQSGGGLLAAEPQIASLAKQLSGLPSGEVSRAMLIDRISQHLKRLNDIGVNLNHISLPADVRVYQSAKGNIHAVRGENARQLQFVIPYSDHAAMAETVETAATMSSSYLLVGVPTPSLWKRLIQQRCANGFVPPIHLIETSEEVFVVWLSMLDGVDIWNKERFILSVGPDAVEKYQRQFTPDNWIMPPTQLLTSHRADWQPPLNRQSFEVWAGRVADVRNEFAAEVVSSYAGRDVAYWQNRFRDADTTRPPLRVVGFTTRYSTVMRYSLRDLGSAFRRLGCDFQLIMQPNDSTAAVNVPGAIKTHMPDMIVVINHLRNEFTDVMPVNVPFVCWIQDHMQSLWSKAAGESIGELDLVVGHGRDVMVSLYGYPADQFIATSNLTAPDVFSADPIPANELEQYRCDVSYVGHGSETPEELVVEMSGGNLSLAQYFHSIRCAVEEFLATHDCINTMQLIQIVLESESASGHPGLPPETRRAVIVPAAQRIMDRVLRHQSLEWVADWAKSRKKQFHIYGRGWERHPQLKQFARGEVEHGEALRRVYQASAVSLQVNGYSSLHQRLLDGVASSTCMLSRYNPNDFISAPHATIQRIIQQRNIQSLKELMDVASYDAIVRQAIAAAEVLVGTRIAPLSDPTRALHVCQHLACGSMTEHQFTDEGLFCVLKNMTSIPSRTAGDIDGFSRTTFRTREQLFQLLDQLTNDRSLAQSLAAPMRQDVLSHDTYDVLAAQIMQSFRFLKKR